MAQWFWRRRVFNSSMYFRNFVIISPWKRTGPFIYMNLNPLWPRMPCAKFGWNWPREDDFSNLLMYFRNYLLSPFGKELVLNLSKLDSPSSKDTLGQVSLKLAYWFWRRTFLKTINVFHNFVIISPLKRAQPLILTNMNLLHQKWFVPSLVEIGQLVLEKKIIF